MDKSYTISEVADKLNLSTKTLRRWEDSGKISPPRTIGGQRRYSIEDLQILDAIKHGTIPSQSDLLAVDQAASLFGVSPQTIIRWENLGKIHPFVTKTDTYYSKTALSEKIAALKRTYGSEPESIPTYRPAPPTPQAPPAYNYQEDETDGGEYPDSRWNSSRPHNKKVDYNYSTNQNIESNYLPQPEVPQNRQDRYPEPSPQPKRHLSPFKNQLKPKPSQPLAKPSLSPNFLNTLFINVLATMLILFLYHLLTSRNVPLNPSTTTTQIAKEPSAVEKLLTNILDATGNLTIPGLLTAKKNLNIGSSLTLSPTSKPTDTPGTFYYDAGTQTFKMFTQGKWHEFPGSQSLNAPASSDIVNGKGAIPKNASQTTITHEAVTSDSLIMVSMSSNFAPAKKYWLTQGKGKFTVFTDFAVANEVGFTYSIINPKAAESSPGPEAAVNPTPTPLPEPDVEGTSSADLP